MTANEYRSLFSDLLNRQNINFGMVLTGYDVPEKDKFDILNMCSFLYQQLHNRNVILLTHSGFREVGEVPCVCDRNSADMFLFKPDSAIIVYVNFPYFDYDKSWEMRFIKNLIYYKIPFIGFSNSQQIISVYEQ